ncbi:MAG: HEAT repeat domain-containing protein [Planctomycetes bacterium]|nr:HEAT repeat domain-containing protein [Planctomycetota bacterium]
MRQIAQLCCGIARLALLVGTPVAAQGLVPDPLVVAIEPLLKSTSPELRGEAALALASTGSPSFYAPLLALAADPHPAARHRAILALGHLGHPGTDVLLQRILDKGPKDAPDRPLAALALGLLAEQPRVPAIDQFFERLDGSSPRRMRPLLGSLLVGMLRTPHPSRVTVLRNVLENASYRRQPILSLVAANLAQVPSKENAAALVATLRRDNPELLRAALRALADPRLDMAPEEIRHVIRLARTHGKSTVRAEALRLLARRRIPEALELAAQALQTQDPGLVGAAIHTALRLGGGELRDQVEARILATPDPRLRAAMTAAKTGPHSDGFVRRNLETARDIGTPFELRVQATRVVAEAGWDEIGPVASTLFFGTDRPHAARILAGALAAAKAPIDKRIHPATTVEDALRLPLRLDALVASGHPDAPSLLLRILKDPHAGNELRLAAVRAYRLAKLGGASPEELANLPPAVLRLVAPKSE